MGGGGGNPIVNIVSTVATAISAPVVGTVALAKEVAGEEATKKVDAIPVVGTVSQGITASGQLYGDVATGVATGDFSEFRADAVPAAKMGVVVAAGYLGAGAGIAATPEAGAFAGTFIGDGIAKKGLDVGSLTGAAAAYFGGYVKDETGIDLNKFLPSGGSKSSGGTYDFGSPPKFIDSVPDYGPSASGGGVTLALGVAALVIFILAMRRKK